jgi:hypothetical protein
MLKKGDSMNCQKMSLLLLVMGASNASLAVTTCTSHVFVPRSISEDLTYINALTYNFVHRKERDKCYTYVGQAIVQDSRKSKQLGAAFLLGTSNEVTVQQAPAAAGATDVINSIWLGLGSTNPDTPFSATFSIKPQRKIFAYHGYAYVNLDSWWCGLWADFAFAVVNARHSLHCEENGSTSDLCPGIATVTQALSSPTLGFGRFFCGLCNNEKRRTGFDDFQIRVGYDYAWCDNNEIGIYAIGTIPSGRKPTAEFVFEPLVGSRHGSVGIGINGDYQFDWCGCEGANFTLMTDANYRFVFSHKDCRTFDLIPNGAFSRFLLLVNSANTTDPIPGVNLLTQRVKVKPRSTVQWWVALNYEYCDWNFELGYNLWWRQKEKINAGTCTNAVVAPLNTGIFDISATNVFTTASTATISSAPGTVPSDPVFVALTNANINIESGLAAKALTNKVYGALSWEGCACDCFDWMAGVGASYEFVSKHNRCAALQNWAAFGKVAVSF